MVAATRIRYRRQPIADELRPTDTARFWKYTERRGDDECWPWLAEKSRYGYGILSIRDGRMKATHFSLILSGRNRPSEKHVACHSCDNPNCVNPLHLWWGTQIENIADATAKGRMSKKLSAESVAKIRSLRGVMPQRKLAAMFDVSQQTIAETQSKEQSK